MKKMTFGKRQEFTVTADQLNFSITTNSGAEPCSEVLDFYKKTLITPTDAALFNNVPNNKGVKRIPILTTGRVTKAFGCPFVDQTFTLDAKEIKVDKMNAMIEICNEDIYESFLVDQMASGANNTGSPAAFFSYVWGEIARQTRADLEYLRWYGDKLSGDAFIKLTNGYMTLIKTNIALVNTVSNYAAITATNVIDKLYDSIADVNPKFRQEYDKLDIFVSSNVALAFAVAASKGNSTAYITGDMGDMFLGKYKITEVATLEDNIILIGPKEDFVFTYDLVDENFVTVDMLTTAAVPSVRYRVNMFYGFDIYNYGNIVYYGPAMVS